jgi:pimeloyl-ACP methyl ester carboxylesterase
MVNFHLHCLFLYITMRSLILFFVLAISLRSWAQFPIGTRSITFYDPDRDRNIGTVIHYPAITAGTDTEVAAEAFPVLVFGHGFLMGVASYNNFRDHFVPRGYILVLPTTEGGFPDHEAFGEDLAFLAEALQSAGAEESSPFFSHVEPRTAMMGHSMGGGASVLGSSNNSTIQTLVNLAAAETDPSAIDAANSVSVPSLIFAATADCVTPPAQHQVPIYDALGSACKALVNIEGGGHCYFANNDGICSLGELSCANSFTIDRAAQHDVVNDIAGLWLDAFLKDDAPAFGAFLDSVSTSSRFSGTTTCLSTGMITEGEHEILVHPVPADRYMIISSIVLAFVTVHSADGRVVERRTLTSGQFTLDTSGYPAGTYYLVQDQEHQRFSKRFVVMH